MGASKTFQPLILGQVWTGLTFAAGSGGRIALTPSALARAQVVVSSLLQRLLVLTLLNVGLKRVGVSGQGLLRQHRQRLIGLLVCKNVPQISNKGV
jgi:hypothetical protein